MSPGPSGGGKFRYVAEINMVPFIDIVLVLLIIFMVMTPLMVKNEIALNLPQSSSTNAQPLKELQVTIQVDPNAVPHIEGKPVAVNQIVATLLGMGANDSSIVSIEADRTLPFERVVEVMDAVKEAGVTKLSVAVTQRKR